MSCWVVPTIAAELWGINIQHVLAGIRDGTIASCAEHGFVFVDVAPASHIYFRPRRPGQPPPPTFVPIRREEHSGVDENELPPLDEEQDSAPLPPRDAVRAAVARRRRPPSAA